MVLGLHIPAVMLQGGHKSVTKEETKMDIRNKEKINELYKELKFWKEFIPEANNPARAEEIMKCIRKEIRREYKRYSKQAREFAACERFCYVKDEYGYYNVEYRKVIFDNREEAAEWCDEYYQNHQVYSMYDCTGEYFVSGISFAHMRDNIYLVRIAWGLDL